MNEDALRARLNSSRLRWSDLPGIPLCKLLDNAALAALIGAAAAFLLVILNDWRRARRSAKMLLPGLLGRLRMLIESRLDGTTKAAQSLSQDMQMRDTALPFPIDRIGRYADQGAAHLSDQQAMALDNLMFWMRESDRLNGVCLELLDQIDVARSDPSISDDNSRMHVPSMTRRLGERYREEIYLLKRINELIAAYLAGTLNERGGIPQQAEPGA
jgi:hypothetical protein